MDYQSYDEYMKSLMGYPNMRASMSPSMSPSMFSMETSSEDLERMYPEVYRVVYPMVCSACDCINMRSPITEQMVDTSPS